MVYTKQIGSIVIDGDTEVDDLALVSHIAKVCIQWHNAFCN